MSTSLKPASLHAFIGECDSDVPKSKTMAGNSTLKVTILEGESIIGADYSGLVILCRRENSASGEVKMLDLNSYKLTHTTAQLVDNLKHQFIATLPSVYSAGPVDSDATCNSFITDSLTVCRNSSGLIPTI